MDASDGGTQNERARLGRGVCGRRQSGALLGRGWGAGLGGGAGVPSYGRNRVHSLNLTKLYCPKNLPGKNLLSDITSNNLTMISDTFTTTDAE